MDDRLLEPGWAGELSPEEFKCVKSYLQKSPSLKQRWGFRPSAKRLPENRIRSVAIDGISTNKKRVLASAMRKQRPC